MRLKETLFISTIVGILLLIFLTQTTDKINYGKVSSIEYSQKKITIRLENQEEKLIIFENKPLNLKEGDEIIFRGRKEIYRNETQIIIDKILCLN